MRHVRSALVISAIVLAAATALAHDFWLSPSSFRPKTDEEVTIRHLVGEHLEGESRKRNESRIETFVARGPGGAEVAVTGKTGDDPAGRVTCPADGTWVVGFRSKGTSISLEAEKFEAYLRDEGLGHVIEERERLGEREKKGLEFYSRQAKAILSAGKGEPGGHDRVLGLRLELVPDANPYRAAAGDEIAFRVLFEGKAIAGVLVRATSQAKPKEPVEARTDADGRVKLRLADAGMWFVGGVHMVRSDVKKTFADWESLWASVTFDLAARPPAAETPK